MLSFTKTVFAQTNEIKFNACISESCYINQDKQTRYTVKGRNRPQAALLLLTLRSATAYILRCATSLYSPPPFKCSVLLTVIAGPMFLFYSESCLSMSEARMIACSRTREMGRFLMRPGITCSVISHSLRCLMFRSKSNTNIAPQIKHIRSNSSAQADWITRKLL